MNEDDKYYGGNLWESPSFMRAMIVCGTDGYMFLISDPAEQGSTVMTEKCGKWLYTFNDLKKRLEKWTWVGNHIKE